MLFARGQKNRKQSDTKETVAKIKLLLLFHIRQYRLQGKGIIRDKECYYTMMKGSNHQEDTILKRYT